MRQPVMVFVVVVVVVVDSLLWLHLGRAFKQVSNSFAHISRTTEA